MAAHHKADQHREYMREYMQKRARAAGVQPRVSREEAHERRKERNRIHHRKERALMQAEMVREIPSAPSGLYGDEFPIFTFALQDTLRFVRHA